MADCEYQKKSKTIMIWEVNLKLKMDLKLKIPKLKLSKASNKYIINYHCWLTLS